MWRNQSHGLRSVNGLKCSLTRLKISLLWYQKKISLHQHKDRRLDINISRLLHASFFFFVLHSTSFFCFCQYFNFTSFMHILIGLGLSQRCYRPSVHQKCQTMNNQRYLNTYSPNPPSYFGKLLCFIAFIQFPSPPDSPVFLLIYDKRSHFFLF